MRLTVRLWFLFMVCGMAFAQFPSQIPETTGEDVPGSRSQGTGERRAVVGPCRHARRLQCAGTDSGSRAQSAILQGHADVLSYDGVPGSGKHQL
jgi:hypothetical protein